MDVVVAVEVVLILFIAVDSVGQDRDPRIGIVDPEAIPIQGSGSTIPFSILKDRIVFRKIFDPDPWIKDQEFYFGSNQFAEY